MNGTRNRRRLRLILHWAPATVYAAGIFVMSSIPGEDLPPLGISDKLTHALVYGGLAVLTCRALWYQKSTWPGWAVAGVAALATFAYGCADELHQGLVSGRRSELADALANGLGAAVASWGWNKAAFR